MENECSFKQLYEVGDHIILKLCSDDIFEGDISDLGTNRIDLINAKQHNNSNTLTGLYSFYRNEIETVQKLKVQETQKPDTAQQNSLENDFNKILITNDEYDRLKTISQEFIYIDKPDSRYFQAIQLLIRAETLGVVGLGIEKNRTGSLKLLAVSIWDKIYLFDFVNQKDSYFYPELKIIFEAEYTCKVIHGAGPFLDILYRKYKVFARNIFDTQVVDMIIKKKETGNVPASLSSMSDLLTDYLHFPSSYLQKALETTISKWAERPLSDRRKGYAAQLVTYLIVLKEHIQRILFKEVYSTINRIHDQYYYMDSFEFSRTWNSITIPKEIEELVPDLAAKVPNETVSNID